MRKGTIAGAAVALVMSLSAAARGEFYDGNRLYAACSEDTSFNQGLCLGIVLGVVNTMSERREELRRRGLRRFYSMALGFPPSCLAKEVVASQIKDVVVQFLTAHPAMRHLSAPSLVANALGRAFPCR